tara:strand:- start:1361 stop:1609 length:249 start_codon:yes stop_codon:yes gene_type:complete
MRNDEKPLVKSPLTFKINHVGELLKKKGFVQQELYSWLGKFTFVIFENGQFKIGHKIENKIGKLTVINPDDIGDAVKYFDRI